MMASPAIESLRKALRNQDNLVADEDENCEMDPAMHPLAAEKWLASSILVALDNPQAVGQLALVNKNFYGASKSDIVWQKLLPPPSHLEALIKECDDPSLSHSASLPPRDLYFRLCKSISLGGGLKKYWLDQRTGGECYIISARALAIAWGSTPQYWEWLPCAGAWFPEVAYLNAVCWFDIAGRFRQLLKPGNYLVTFRIWVRPVSPCWRGTPIKLSLQNLTSARPRSESQVIFHGQFPVSEPPIAPPASTVDEGQQSWANDPDSLIFGQVWAECDVGEFSVEENEDSPIEVEFSMREVELGRWKSGFLLDGVIIRPSYVINGQDRASVLMGLTDDGYGEELWAVDYGFIDEGGDDGDGDGGGDDDDDDDDGDGGGDDDDDDDDGDGGGDDARFF